MASGGARRALCDEVATESAEPAPKSASPPEAGAVPALRTARESAARKAEADRDDAAVLRAMRAGGGLRLLGLRIVIVLVLLMAAQAYDGSLHALSHWIILGLYGLGTVWFGLGERGEGPSATAYGWAGTLLNAGLAVYVIIEHMLAGGGAGLGADAVSRLPAFLLLLQTGLSMRVAQTVLFCALVTACWSAAFLVGLAHPELFPGPDTFPTAQITGLATFVAAGLLVVDGVTRLRDAVARALRMEHERARLARFVPDAVALDLAGEDAFSARGAHRRHACLMVLDIRGFSRLSREHPPEAMVAALLAVRAAAQAAVAEQGGLVDKYVGDAVLVQFVVGRPDAQAQAALTCALAIHDRIAALNAARAADGLFTLRVVVALHAGDLLVGVFDDGVRAEYTVLGPAMNALSRLEGRAKAAEIEIAASGDFLDLLGGPLPPGVRAVPVPDAAPSGRPALFAIASEPAA
ncbi:adenylate/guanylate cyclase domain-containing protein [Methylobacterium sp. NEAU K]|uniref:adenylate/guanylate cyclase domain-containing protein n=1 Tax=Methylobacterium sp. NEAU K TaxID=3064946 RepID=UPI002735933F|nr:adenylate/guanylate cyclase domain-containing protein [Methylobacterium sp. NEAU K]MDP4006280.1 adenylate/guanylate cyclase domain-containing protein [Methylobacterium sp. NEAU K]